MFEAVVAQAAMLRDLDATPVIFAVADEHHAHDRWRLEGCEIHAVSGFGPRKLAYAPGLGRALGAARLDLLHLHGIWQLPVKAAGNWVQRTGCPLVISPHGMLDPWITSRGTWKKRLARTLWERTSWRNAAAFHALTGAEEQDIGRETGHSRIVTIPNAAPEPGSPPDYLRGPHALYLGRIHAKKNIEALIAGWQLAQPDLPEGATLTIAGWGDDDAVTELGERLSGLTDTIQFVGAAFESQKRALFDISRFCVLPSHSEGLPIVVLEAWSQGTPTIMTEACHLPEGFGAGAAIPCGTSAEGIHHALLTAFTLDEAAWLDMAEAAQTLARTEFSAKAVTGKWESFYGSLLA